MVRRVRYEVHVGSQGLDTGGLALDVFQYPVAAAKVRGLHLGLLDQTTSVQTTIANRVKHLKRALFLMIMQKIEETSTLGTRHAWVNSNVDALDSKHLVGQGACETQRSSTFDCIVRHDPHFADRRVSLIKVTHGLWEEILSAKLMEVHELIVRQ